eukprot:scaffold128343_cov30-Tisochrysis_lutea.AAC.3
MAFGEASSAWQPETAKDSLPLLEQSLLDVKPFARRVETIPSMRSRMRARCSESAARFNSTRVFRAATWSWSVDGDTERDDAGSLPSPDPEVVSSIADGSLGA